MKKIILSLMLLMSVAGIVSGQTRTVRAFTSGAADEGNSFGVFGQPFATMTVSGTGFELTEGVAQMQLERDTFYAVINYEAAYTDNGFNLPNQTKSHKDSVYKVNGAEFNYDLISTLYLIVCPGPDSVKDNGDNYYNTVAVSGYCWTKSNMRYATENAMTYTSNQYPDVNVETYGYLYTWQDAVADSDPNNDDNGYVQGICPSVGWGWHLPNAEEATALMSNEALTLRSETDWIGTEVNTNSTMFTAYPAGEYSGELGRFQGMGTQTDCWTAMSTGNSYATSIQLNYYCSSPMLKVRSQNDGLSVRCVMYNNWEALDELDIQEEPQP